MLFRLPSSFDRMHAWRLIRLLALGMGVCVAVELMLGLRYRHYPFDWRWPALLGGGGLLLAVLPGLWYAGLWLDKRLPWEKSARRRFAAQWTMQTGWVVGVAAVVRHSLLRPLLHAPPRFINADDELLIAGVVAAVVTLVVAADLALFLLNKWRVSLAQLERFKKESIEFRLEMLKTQVNPHFLFNSLNTLSSLIYTDSDTAAEFVRQLANVYRYVLENRTRELVPLREELTFLQAYMYLMDLRFGHSLRVHTQLPDAAQQFAIAPLTLQMLIENATKHNIVSQKKPLEIRIFQAEPAYLVVQNVLQRKPVKEFSSQIGLENIRSRYRFITDREVQVVDDGLTFAVRIPLVAHADHPFDIQPAV